MRNFPSKHQKRKRRYQRSYESSSYEEIDNKEKYYIYPKKKKTIKDKKDFDYVDGDYDDVDVDNNGSVNDEEFSLVSENDNDNSDNNDENRNTNKNNKKVIQKQKQKPKKTNKKGISKSTKV